MPLIIFLIISFILNLTPLSEAKEATIYKYKDANGVVSFSDNVESIPESLRDSVETIERKSSKTIEPTAPKRFLQNIPSVPMIQDFLLNGWKNPIVIGLLVVIAILLFWCIKLWIKNIIFKFISRIAIKVALAGLLYIAGHYLYREFVPIKKAEETIERFQEKQEETKQSLDTIGLNP